MFEAMKSVDVSVQNFTNELFGSSLTLSEIPEKENEKMRRELEKICASSDSVD